MTRKFFGELLTKRIEIKLTTELQFKALLLSKKKKKLQIFLCHSEQKIIR